MSARVPAASVCVPVYQGEATLEATLRSVLAQTFDDYELVVLDNASTDASGEIARSFAALDPRVRVETNAETLPIQANFNRAVRHARAPLVKVLCADDLIRPRCLEIQVAALAADPALSFVVSREDLVDAQGRILAASRFLQGFIGVRDHRDVVRRVVRHGANPLGTVGGVLFRRTAFDATGGFGGEAVVSDLDLFLRLLEHGPMRGLPESLAAFRIDAGTITAGAQRHIDTAQRVFTRELAERTGVGRPERLLGALRAPGGRLRRRAAYQLAAFAQLRERLASRGASPVP